MPLSGLYREVPKGSETHSDPPSLAQAQRCELPAAGLVQVAWGTKRGTQDSLKRTEGSLAPKSPLNSALLKTSDISTPGLLVPHASLVDHLVPTVIEIVVEKVSGRAEAIPQTP